MKVDYLFSKNNRWGSRLISWASTYEKLDNIDKDKVPSHVAVLLNDKFVIESVMSGGVRMIPYSQWQIKNTEVYRVRCIQDDRPSKEVFDHLARVWGKPYDWRGILYFGYAFIRFIIGIDKQLKQHNPWQRDSHFFCTEFAGRLSGQDHHMTSPAKMCDSFLEGDS